MHRDERILKFFDRSGELSIKNEDYGNFVASFFDFLLESDIGKGDITSSLIGKTKKTEAMIVAKEEGIIAGLDEMKILNSGLELKFLREDGERINPNDVIVVLEGNAREILKRERTILNMLQRMSGIATITSKLVNMIGDRPRIAATRKTFWGHLDKKAVSVGKGLTHRLDLSDGILIKDNHIKLSGNDIYHAISSSRNRFIEIEVENKEQALTAAEAIKKNLNNSRSYAIMFDKISPVEIKSIFKELKKKKIYDKILFEASGNINESNIIGYKDCGIDVISMGSLTNSAKILNMSLEIK